MLKRKQIIRLKRDLGKLFKSKRIYFKYFTVFYYPKINKEDPSFFVSIPKRYLKLAVDRNQMKRKVKHILSEQAIQLEKLNIQIGIVYKTKQILSHADLSKEMKEMASKLVKLHE